MPHNLLIVPDGDSHILAAHTHIHRISECEGPMAPSTTDKKNGNVFPMLSIGYEQGIKQTKGQIE